jgi:hydroxymethylpyrimidine pyrophosphatase-like HAD family hydrolase
VKTIICDIDGTIFKYSPGGTNQLVNEEPVLLSGVKEKFNQWEMAGHRIIIITGRRESLRKLTEIQLTNAGIAFDTLLMGYADEGRILINDMNSNYKVKAHVANLLRDKGFDSWNWDDIGLE